MWYRTGQGAAYGWDITFRGGVDRQDPRQNHRPRVETSHSIKASHRRQKYPLPSIRPLRPLRALQFWQWTTQQRWSHFQIRVDSHLQPSLLPENPRITPPKTDLHQPIPPPPTTLQLLNPNRQPIRILLHLPHLPRHPNLPLLRLQMPLWPQKRTSTNLSRRTAVQLCATVYLPE